MAAFLAGHIGWLQIADVIAEVLEMASVGNARDVADVVEADERARERARDAVKRRSAA